MTETETTPLLSGGGGGKQPSPKKWAFFTAERRVLFAGFLISLSFSYTQTPILYVFHVMVCDEFYRHAPPYEGPGDRCSRNEIDSGAAAQVAIMGSATIVFAIANLFVAGWQMRRAGPRAALAVQTFFPVIRVCTQALSLVVGAREGIVVMQTSQVFTILGGPAGYILVLNTIIAEITEPAARTAMFGVLQGVLMLGVSAGYLIGGAVAEEFGVRRPFELAAVSLAACCVYTLLFVPYVDPKALNSSDDRGKNSSFLASIIGPWKALSPQRLRLKDGRVVKHFGIMFLALGIYMGVLATGFAPTLIQLYSMTVFKFNPTNNSLLMSVASLIRGMFLMFIFPQIIALGRRWFKTSNAPPVAPKVDPETAIPTEPLDFDPLPVTVPDPEPAKPPATVEEDAGGGFDLFFLRYSLLVDGIITASSAFATKGWHMYLVAFLLPLASGSAPASKGVITQMVAPSQKADALQAMTLVECIGSLSTLGIFGAVYSTLAEAGKPYVTFYCNAAVAVVAVGILLFSTFPPRESELVVSAEETAANPDSTNGAAEGEHQ